MEPIIKLKDYLLKGLIGLLSPGEHLLAAIPYGGVQADSSRVALAADRNYLLMTDTRIITLKGRYFKDKTGLKVYPRRLITGADLKHFLYGSTITLLFRNESRDDEEIRLDLPNCGKPEAEAIVGELCYALQNVRNCPACMQRLTKDFTFCPHCGRALKKLCPCCGKPIDPADGACKLCTPKK